MYQRVPTMEEDLTAKVDHAKCRYPFCIVWTPIPVISWLLPFIGHMGIATSRGVIRDFAGPYYVSEDDMAFGAPTRYWKLNPAKALNGADGWDKGVAEASTIYNGRIHNLCCDNCHSHVATALNLMTYDGKTNWNMVNLCFFMLFRGRYVSVARFVKSWLPSLVLVVLIVTLSVVL